MKLIHIIFLLIALPGIYAAQPGMTAELEMADTKAAIGCSQKKTNSLFETAFRSIAFIRVYPNILPVPAELNDMQENDADLKYEAKMDLIVYNSTPINRRNNEFPETQKTELN
ncbi:MAG: hypothetical protein JNL60_01135 [Bacteroidia bacterium]|nr:hypothetical protein [Bacteroidia bacterium]